MNNQNIKKELIEMGFLEEHIDLALKITSNQEEAIETIIKMLEDENFYKQMKYNCLSNNSNSNNNYNQNQFKMTIAVRKDLNMSTGKIAAQVGHGVLNTYKLAVNTHSDYVKLWENYSGSAKIVLSVNSLKEITELGELAKKENLPFSIITDAGRTEIEPNTITVIAIGPGPSNLIDKVTGKLELFK